MGSLEARATVAALSFQISANQLLPCVGIHNGAQSSQIVSIGALTFWWSMVEHDLSESGFPLFRILR
jgi:hypothetical protein